MRKGSVYQRHTNSCPRDESGKLTKHKCRGPWSYWLLVGKDASGARKQMSRSGYATRKEADAALQELLAGDVLEAAGVQRLTVSDYLEQWLEGKRALRPSTRRGYESHVRLYLRPHLGAVRLTELRPQHLDRMYQDLLTSGTRSVATVRRVHATLHSALNTAVKRRYIAWNVADHVELPTARRPKTKVWTATQLGEFLDETVDERLYALFHVAAFTGLRRGELLGLRWVDVHTDVGYLLIEQQLVDTGQALEIGPPKTQLSERFVPMDADTCDVLEQHRRAQQAERRAWGDAWIDTGLVFTRQDGQMLRPDHVTKLFRKLAQRAGAPRIRLHDLRHTCASLGLLAGVPMKVVSERLGHSTTTITANLYTHVVPELAREAAEKIAASVPRRKARKNPAHPQSYESPTSEPPDEAKEGDR